MASKIAYGFFLFGLSLLLHGCGAANSYQRSYVISKSHVESDAAEPQASEEKADLSDASQSDAS